MLKPLGLWTCKKQIVIVDLQEAGVVEEGFALVVHGGLLPGPPP